MSKRKKNNSLNDLIWKICIFSSIFSTSLWKREWKSTAKKWQQKKHNRFGSHLTNDWNENAILHTLSWLAGIFVFIFLFIHSFIRLFIWAAFTSSHDSILLLKWTISHIVRLNGYLLGSGSNAGTMWLACALCANDVIRIVKFNVHTVTVYVVSYCLLHVWFCILSGQNTEWQ